MFSAIFMFNEWGTIEQTWSVFVGPSLANYMKQQKDGEKAEHEENFRGKFYLLI